MSQISFDFFAMWKVNKNILPITSFLLEISKELWKNINVPYCQLFTSITISEIDPLRFITVSHRKRLRVISKKILKSSMFLNSKIDCTHFVNRVSLQQLLPGGYSSCTKDLSMDDSRPVDGISEIFFSLGLFHRTTNLGDLFVATSGLK